MLLVFGLLLFVLLVVIHEFGHFLVARRNGVEVEEFGIGFPPRVAGKKMGKGIFKSYYSLNLLPLGGFVKLKGESDSDKRKGSFGAASLWVKTKITMAGVLTNFAAAALIFSVLSFTGMPVLIDNQVSIGDDTTESYSPVKVGYIEENSVAASSDLEEDDDIISANGVEFSAPDDLYDFTEANSGREVEINYVRDGVERSETLTLGDNQNNEGYLGVVPYQIATRKSTISAPLNGVAVTGQFAWETLSGLADTIGKVIRGDISEAGDNVSGPVGIFVILRNIDSVSILMMFIGLISLTLAIMNALPIPALDGGRLAVMYFFRLIKKPLTAEREQAIHGRGMAVLLMIVALITLLDINRFF